MARSTSEEEIRLRKRARRRLIGAIALTTLVAHPNDRPQRSSPGCSKYRGRCWKS